MLASRYGAATGNPDALHGSLGQTNGICTNSNALQRPQAGQVNPSTFGRGAGGAIPGGLAKHRVPKNGSSLSQAIRTAERKGVDRTSRDSAGAADRAEEARRERCLLFIKSIEETTKARQKSSEDVYSK